MNAPKESTNYDKEHHITSEELITQLEAAGLNDVANSIKNGTTTAYNVAEDIVVNKKLQGIDPKNLSLNFKFSKEEADKYHKMSEEFVAQMLLDHKNAPLKNKISELREGFHPTSDNDNKPSNT